MNYPQIVTRPQVAPVVDNGAECAGWPQNGIAPKMSNFIQEQQQPWLGDELGTEDRWSEIK